MDADRQAEDLSSDFIAASTGKQQSQDVAEMEEFLRAARTNGIAQSAPVQEPSGDPGRPLPQAKPLRSKTDDVLGRLPVEETKSALRNIAEIPKAGVAGVESAIKNSLGWAIDPLANWLNENVADLSYDRNIKTPTGEIVKSASEFLTGFIPFTKALKGMGLVNGMVNPMVAGAMADFAVRDPSSGRLADLWKKLELPQNVLTEFLASKPDDTQMEGRFKNALEGTGLGVLTEGIFMAARALRAVKNVRGEAQAEKDYLKNKYGEVTDDTMKKIVGDPTKPAVEMVVREPSKAPAKIIEGAKATVDFAPRSVIRNKAKPAPTYQRPADVREIVDPDEARSMAFDLQEKYKDAPAIDANVINSGDRQTDAVARMYTALREAGDDDTGRIALIVKQDESGAPIAVASYSERKGGHIRIHNIGAINKGDGAVLLADIKSMGRSIELNANPPAIAAYERAGFKATGKTGEQGTKGMRYDPSNVNPKDFDVYINFAKFDEPDQIKFAIGKMAEIGKGSIDEATRGVITQKETERLAENLGMTVTDLLARRKGQGFNAEEAVAARQLWAASGERLVELAKIAAGKNAGDIDQYAFRKAMATHYAIQAEVIGARTETARALQAWAIPVKGNIERARAIDQVINAMGGPKVSAEMARRIAILAETNADPAAIARFVEKGWGAASMDAVREAWVNGLLSNPKTHMVNMFSNTLVAANAIAERAVAGGIRSATGGEGVQALEAVAMTHGLVTSIREAWQMAAKAVRTGETSWTFNKSDLPKMHSISAEAFAMSKETGLGRAVDFLGNATRVPTRLLGAEDEFFKTIGYRMELHAQAMRQAISEGHRGYDLGKRMAEIITNPPEHIMINAADAALYNTFTSEVGAFGRAVMNLRNIDHPLNPLVFVLPFVRTPVNIARYAFERTPLAPLVSQWRADISAGGARADLALARMATGTTALLTVMDLADKGHITGAGFRGGKDTALQEAQERQGWQPYSIKVGNKWYSYNRADPFGMIFGFGANIAEAVRKGDINEDEIDEWQEVSAMSIAAISQVVVNKTYLEGLARAVEVVSDSKRYSQKYIDDLFASFTPATALNAGVKNLVDPVNREVSTPMEAVYARIAGLSDKLPPRRNLWGQEIRNESSLGKAYDFLSPVGVKDIKNSPIDREMVRLNHGQERIQKNTSFDGVQANMRFYPKAYDDYVRLAGNDLKHPQWGMGAKDFLDSVVSGGHPMSALYNTMSDETRRSFIQTTIQQYRQLAQREVLADPKHSKFKQEIDRLKEIHRDSRMPVT